MTRPVRVAVAALLVVSWIAPVAALPTVESLQGSVRVRSGPSQGPDREVTGTAALAPGDRVSVLAGGSALLELEGARVRVPAGSVVEVGKPDTLTLEQGSLLSEVDRPLTILAGNSRVESATGQFLVRMSPDRSVRLKVYSGTPRLITDPSPATVAAASLDLSKLAGRAEFGRRSPDHLAGKAEPGTDWLAGKAEPDTNWLAGKAEHGNKFAQAIGAAGLAEIGAAAGGLGIVPLAGGLGALGGLTGLVAGGGGGGNTPPPVPTPPPPPPISP